MRSSTLILLASVLAAENVVAGALRGHRAHQAIHNRDVVVDDVVVTVYETVTVDYDDGATTTSAPASTTTISISSVVPTTTTTPAAAQEAEFLAVSASSSTTTSTTTTPSAVPTTTTTTTTTTPAAVPTTFATSTSTTTSAAAASTASSDSSVKRGLPYNTASLLSAFLGGSEKYWAYNWGSSSDGLSSSFEFVPMLWGLGSEFTSDWSSAASSALESGSTALLAFNEPDLAAQSNIGYVAAAAGYKTFMEPFAGKALLGAPAVTNGAAPMGLTYLSNFVEACVDCTIDFCPIHWYDSASNVDYFKSYVADAQTACGGKPIWITEMGASGSDAEQATFISTVVPWLESQDYVHRYAYFMASDGVMLSGTSLSVIGQAFAEAS